MRTDFKCPAHENNSWNAAFKSGMLNNRGPTIILFRVFFVRVRSYLEGVRFSSTIFQPDSLIMGTVDTHPCTLGHKRLHLCPAFHLSTLFRDFHIIFTPLFKPKREFLGPFKKTRWLPGWVTFKSKINCQKGVKFRDKWACAEWYLIQFDLIEMYFVSRDVFQSIKPWKRSAVVRIHPLFHINANSWWPLKIHPYFREIWT